LVKRGSGMWLVSNEVGQCHPACWDYRRGDRSN
jgi:hypothetical protein